MLESIPSVCRISEVLACELLIASEALSQREQQSSPIVNSLIKLVRNIAPILDGDRATSAEINKIAEFLRDGSWLARIEAENHKLSR